MRKIVALMLAALFVFAAIGCSDDANDGEVTENNGEAEAYEETPSDIRPEYIIIDDMHIHTSETRQLELDGHQVTDADIEQLIIDGNFY